MINVSVRLTALAVLPLLGSWNYCWATSTKSWLSSSYADFDKGELKGLSLRSDGRITLAPKQQELFDSSLAYLWALAQDSKGVLYAGGGPGARVYRYANGKCEKIAEFDAIEVHSIAVDRQDRVYAATFPDGKIFRVSAGAKPELFYDPKCKYIWSMIFDAAGNLYVATGDKGEIRRVTPDGKGEVFFRSEDTHVRAFAWSGKDLIAGTDPTGLVIRVNPQGQGYVLYQLPKREVTALAIGPDGSIYAAGAGIQQTGGGPSALLAALATPPATSSGPASPGGTTIVVTPSPPASAERGAPRAAPLTGGSEVYRIDRTGQPLRIWSHPHDVVYAVAFDRSGAPILGAGNKGNLYRVDSPSLYTSLTSADANQITALLPEPDGALIAATANVGKVYQFGADLAKQGTVTSEVFDSGAFSTWGRLTSYGDEKGKVRLESHSGNLDRPRNFWSDWSTATPPPARFIQWRATLDASSAAGGASPILDSVEQAYLSRNIAPQIDEIEATPPNYRFPAPVVATILSRLPASIALPPIGRRAGSGISLGSDSDTSSMSYAKGWAGVRWAATDENNDPLIYTLEIRGVNETQWRPLKDKLSERHYSFDATTFPDGEYRIRVTASDQPGNPFGDALTAELISSPILIDNTPPAITALTPTVKGSSIRVTWKAIDALSVIKHAEYSIDGDDWLSVEPVSKLSDAQSLEYALTLSVARAGEHLIAVRVTDDYDNSSVEKVITR
jgi:hypothetical protein